jgi:hypothetical protein
MTAEPVSKRIESDPSMLEAVEEALLQMPWLRPSDFGLVALARRLAVAIDATEDPRAIGYLAQNLANALRSLGGAPVERKALDVEGSAGGRLGELRKARASRVGSTTLVYSTSAEANA